MDGNKSNINDQQFISFQDYSPINRSGGQALLDIGIPDQQPTGNLGNLPTSQPPPNDNFQSTPEQSTGTATSSPSFWTIEYYQKFFNITTKDVLERIKLSMIPLGTESYLISHIRPNPDLYGPFWICITLVFSIAISGNLANYIQTADSVKYHWKYDFHLVSYAATCIFLYAWLLPLSIWGALKWTNSQQSNNQDELIQSNTSIGLLEILCVYGYSLAIYIPVAFLWTIQVTVLQWTLVIVAACLSGGILLRSLSPAISGRHKIIYMGIILSLHLLLAIGFMLYFFHDSKSIPVPVHDVTSPPAKTDIPIQVTTPSSHNATKAQ